MESGADYKYWAFISYTHCDQRWARWLHGSLETFSIPSGTVAPLGLSGSKTLAPVFRDRDELASNANLSEQLRQALEASRHLIVICSKAVAKSRWVEEEVAVFRRLGRSERILCLIVDDADEPAASGGPGRVCVPPWLLDPTPLGADARPEADGKRNALLKIAAALLEVPFDTLRRRHDVRRRQVMMLTVVASLFGCALFAVTTFWALAQRSLANEEKARAVLATEQRTATLAASYFVQASSASRSSHRLAYLAKSLRLNPKRQGAIAATALALATETVAQSFEPVRREKDAGEDAEKPGRDENGDGEHTEADEGDPFDPANISPSLRIALSLDDEDRIDPNLPREHPLQESGRRILIQLRTFIGGDLESSASDSLYYQRLWRMADEAVTSPDKQWIWLHEADLGNSAWIPRLDVQIDTKTQQPIASYDFRINAGHPSFTPDSRFVIAYPHVIDIATQAQVVDLHELAPDAVEYGSESNPSAVVTLEPGWRVSWRLPTLPMRIHDIVNEFQLVRDHLLVERESPEGDSLVEVYDLRSQSLVACSAALPEHLEGRLSYGGTTMLIEHKTEDDEEFRAKAPAMVRAVDLKTRRRLGSETEIPRPYFEFGDGALIAKKEWGLICLNTRTGNERMLPTFSAHDVLISEDRQRAMVSGWAVPEGVFDLIRADASGPDAGALSSGTVALGDASTGVTNGDALVFDADSPEPCEPVLTLHEIGLPRFGPNRAIYALDEGGAITRYERDGTKRVLAQATPGALFPWAKEEHAAPDSPLGDIVTPAESRLNRIWGGFAVSDDGNFAIIVRPSYVEVFHIGSGAVQNAPTRIEPECVNAPETVRC